MHCDSIISIHAVSVISVASVVSGESVKANKVLRSWPELHCQQGWQLQHQQPLSWISNQQRTRWVSNGQKNFVIWFRGPGKSSRIQGNSMPSHRIVPVGSALSLALLRSVRILFMLDVLTIFFSCDSTDWSVQWIDLSASSRFFSWMRLLTALHSHTHYILYVSMH